MQRACSRVANAIKTGAKRPPIVLLCALHSRAASFSAAPIRQPSTLAASRGHRRRDSGCAVRWASTKEPLAADAVRETILRRLLDQSVPDDFRTAQAIFKEFGAMNHVDVLRTMLPLVQREIGPVNPVSLFASMQALSRWQNAHHSAKVLPGDSAMSNDELDAGLLDETFSALRFATAAYGWKGIVFFSLTSGTASAGFDGVGSLLRSAWGGDTTSFCDHAGIPPAALLFASGEAEVGVPKHFICMNDERRQIVLAIRGTMSINDAFTDLVARHVQYADGEAHEGIAHAAHAIYAGTMDTLTHELEARPGYSLVVTGHSLGAATALLFTILLHHHRRKQLADPRLPASAVPYHGVDVKCIAFAPPPVYSPLSSLPPEVHDSISCWVHNEDLVPRLTLRGLRDLVRILRKISEHEPSSVRRMFFSDVDIQQVLETEPEWLEGWYQNVERPQAATVRAAAAEGAAEAAAAGGSPALGAMAAVGGAGTSSRDVAAAATGAAKDGSRSNSRSSSPVMAGAAAAPTYSIEMVQLPVAAHHAASAVAEAGSGFASGDSFPRSTTFEAPRAPVRTASLRAMPDLAVSEPAAADSRELHAGPRRPGALPHAGAAVSSGTLPTSLSASSLPALPDSAWASPQRSPPSEPTPLSFDPAEQRDATSGARGNSSACGGAASAPDEDGIPHPLRMTSGFSRVAAATGDAVAAGSAHRSLPIGPTPGIDIGVDKGAGADSTDSGDAFGDGFSSVGSDDSGEVDTETGYHLQRLQIPGRIYCFRAPVDIGAANALEDESRKAGGGAASGDASDSDGSSVDASAADASANGGGTGVVTTISSSIVSLFSGVKSVLGGGGAPAGSGAGTPVSTPRLRGQPTPASGLPVAASPRFASTPATATAVPPGGLVQPFVLTDPAAAAGRESTPAPPGHYTGISSGVAARGDDGVSAAAGTGSASATVDAPRGGVAGLASTVTGAASGAINTAASAVRGGIWSVATAATTVANGLSSATSSVVNSVTWSKDGTAGGGGAGAGGADDDGRSTGSDGSGGGGRFRRFSLTRRDSGTARTLAPLQPSALSTPSRLDAAAPAAAGDAALAGATPAELHVGPRLPRGDASAGDSRRGSATAAALPAIGALGSAAAAGGGASGGGTDGVSQRDDFHLQPGVAAEAAARAVTEHLPFVTRVTPQHLRNLPITNRAWRDHVPDMYLSALRQLHEVAQRQQAVRQQRAAAAAGAAAAAPVAPAASADATAVAAPPVAAAAAAAVDEAAAAGMRVPPAGSSTAAEAELHATTGEGGAPTGEVERQRAAVREREREERARMGEAATPVPLAAAAAGQQLETAAQPAGSS